MKIKDTSPSISHSLTRSLANSLTPPVGEGLLRRTFVFIFLTAVTVGLSFEEPPLLLLSIHRVRIDFCFKK